MYVSSRQGYKPHVKSTGKVKEYTHFASLKYCNGAEMFYRALVCLATLPTVICLILSFSPLGQMFAAGFFQIPTHDGHPCPWLCNSRY